MRLIDIANICISHSECIDCKYCKITKEDSRCTVIPEVNKKLQKYYTCMYMDDLIEILLEEVNIE